MTPAEIAEASKCYKCIPDQWAALLYLADQIVDGGGGGGTQEVFSLAGSATPVAIPASGNGVAYNGDGNMWIYTALGWEQRM